MAARADRREHGTFEMEAEHLRAGPSPSVVHRGAAGLLKHAGRRHESRDGGGRHGGYHRPHPVSQQRERHALEGCRPAQDVATTRSMAVDVDEGRCQDLVARQDDGSGRVSPQRPHQRRRRVELDLADASFLHVDEGVYQPAAWQQHGSDDVRKGGHLDDHVASTASGTRATRDPPPEGERDH